MNESQRRLLYWLVVGVTALILCYLLWISFPFYRFIFSFLFAVLTPILISAFLAYLLYPIVQFLHQFMPRWLAILILYVVIFGGIFFAVYRAYPIFVRQLEELISNLPALMETYQDWIYNLYIQTASFPEAVHDQMDATFTTIENKLVNILKNVIYSFAAITDLIVIAAVIPILVFYFLKDYPKMESSFTAIVKEKQKFSAYLDRIDYSLGGYLRGQLIVCLFVGIISTLFLWFIKMKYPLILGIFMGLTNIIPYFGPILGAIPAVIIAFTISSKKVVFVIGMVVVVQLLESNFLSPYIVGKSLHVHPILIIFALLIGAEAFGILGMILAVPVLTIAKVFIEPTSLITKMKRAWKREEN